MADTVVPTIMEIVTAHGGSGEPKTVIEALELLSEVMSGAGEGIPISNAEIDTITNS